MEKRCYPVLLHSGRLVARTPAFQVGEAGSKPVRSTSQLGAVVGYGFALQAYCLEGFDTLGLHQFNGLHVLAGKYAVGHSPSEALVQFQRSPLILSL